MKKTMTILMATSLFFAATVPAMAMDHASMHHQQQHDAQCIKECDMLLKNCGQQVDSIQQRIRKLQAAIQNKGNIYTSDELTILKQKLDDVQKTLANMEKGGR